MPLSSLLIETSVGVRLSDNLLNHAQIMYRIAGRAPRAAEHRARFPLALDDALARRLAHLVDDPAAVGVPRLLVLMCDDPMVEGVRRSLARPALPVLAGEVVAQVGRVLLRLAPDALLLTWQACEQVFEDHYRDHWAAREPALSRLALEADERLAYADLPYKLAHLTGRQPPHANLEVNLLDTEALISYSAGGERICVATAMLARFERLAYIFAHECARIYLGNPPWWEVEPCASACRGLSAALLDAVENCAAQYLAATLAVGYGPDPGFWMVHPQVEAALAEEWPAFVAAPHRGIDLLLERVLNRVREADPHAQAVRPRRLSVTCDGAGNPARCTVIEQRF